jgi:hypothetical protein
MRKQYDPDVAEYENKVRSARDSTQLYISLARNAKNRGDIATFVDCWYKMKFNRMTAQYWTLALHQRQPMITLLSAPRQKAQ